MGKGGKYLAKKPKRRQNPAMMLLKGVFTLAVAVLCCVVSVNILTKLAQSGGKTGSALAGGGVELTLMDRFDMRMNNQVSSALDGVLDIKKVYWLSDDDMVAPKPNPANFGKTKDPASLAWIIEQTKNMMDGQELRFASVTNIPRGSEINYYVDETILAITWKQIMDGSHYTICEVKINHPSQLRRFLAGGEYGSEIQLQTTQMAASVNAVLASAGDFYGYRREGVIVYDGIVRRTDVSRVETCYIDDKGDMHLSYIGQLGTMEEAQRFVDENNIRFSLSFGPVLVDKGEKIPVDAGYYVGQPADPYPRAALCQLGELHYLVVTVNKEPDNGTYGTQSIYTFQKNIQTFDPYMAYCIDGGQTATVVMNGEVLNTLATGSQRYISDIFYFATALPEEE